VEKRRTGARALAKGLHPSGSKAARIPVLGLSIRRKAFQDARPHHLTGGAKQAPSALGSIAVRVLFTSVTKAQRARDGKRIGRQGCWIGRA